MTHPPPSRPPFSRVVFVVCAGEAISIANERMSYKNLEVLASHSLSEYPTTVDEVSNDESGVAGLDRLPLARTFRPPPFYLTIFFFFYFEMDRTQDTHLLTGTGVHGIGDVGQALTRNQRLAIEMRRHEKLVLIAQTDLLSRAWDQLLDTGVSFFGEGRRSVGCCVARCGQCCFVCCAIVVKSKDHRLTSWCNLSFYFVLAQA